MLFSTMPPPRGTWRAFIGAARGALRAAAVEAMRMVLMSFMVVYLHAQKVKQCTGRKSADIDADALGDAKRN